MRRAGRGPAVVDDVPGGDRVPERVLPAGDKEDDCVEVEGEEDVGIVGFLVLQAGWSSFRMARSRGMSVSAK